MFLMFSETLIILTRKKAINHRVPKVIGFAMNTEM